MNKHNKLLLFFFLLIGLLISSCGDEQEAKVKIQEVNLNMEDIHTRLSYAWGMTGAGYFQEASQYMPKEHIHVDQVLDGFKDAKEDSARYSFEEAQVTIGTYFEKFKQNQTITEKLAKNYCYAQGIVIDKVTNNKMAEAGFIDKAVWPAFYMGMHDELSGAKTAISDEEATELMMNLKNDRLSDDKSSQDRVVEELMIKNRGGFQELENNDRFSYAVGVMSSQQLISYLYSPQFEPLADKIDTIEFIAGVEDEIKKEQKAITNETFIATQKQLIEYLAKPDDMPIELAKDYSYMLGVIYARNSLMQGTNYDIDIDKGFFLKGTKDVMVAREAMAEIETISDFLNQSARQAFVKREKDFLSRNKNLPGIKETATGLQYKVLKMGNGPKPGLKDKVKVHYHGTFLNGNVFDSSVEKGEPIEFPVTGVISGWTEGLQLMPEGSKFMFYVPYRLAYGERGTQGIPAYSTLIFEVELLEVI